MFCLSEQVWGILALEILSPPIPSPNNPFPTYICPQDSKSVFHLNVGLWKNSGKVQVFSQSQVLVRATQYLLRPKPCFHSSPEAAVKVRNRIERVKVVLRQIHSPDSQLRESFLTFCIRMSYSAVLGQNPLGARTLSKPLWYPCQAIAGAPWVLIKLMSWELASFAQWLEVWPTDWRVSGLIQVKGTYLSCRLDPWPQ